MKIKIKLYNAMDKAIKRYGFECKKVLLLSVILNVLGDWVTQSLFIIPLL